MISVAKWWNKLIDEYDKKGQDYTYKLVEKGVLQINSFETRKKVMVINFLSNIFLEKKSDYLFAMDILIEFSDENILSIIYKKAYELKTSYKSDERYYIWLMRYLAKNANAEKLDLVEDYLFSKGYRYQQQFIQWYLWPKNKELFFKSYTFCLESLQNMPHAGIVQIFMKNPEALNELKIYLKKESKDNLWLTLKNDLKFELEKSIWNNEDKNLIKEIIN